MNSSGKWNKRRRAGLAGAVLLSVHMAAFPTGAPAAEAAELSAAAGAIVHASWGLQNGGVVTAGNQHYYELNSRFTAAEAAVVSIAYEYSIDGEHWEPVMELSPVAVTRYSGNTWHRPVRVDLDDAPEGTLQLRATATDASGNAFAASTTLSKDATVPAGVTGAAGTVTSDGKHALTWTNPAADFRHVVLHRRIPGYSDGWTELAGSYTGESYTATAIAGLAYEYRITPVDAVGNAAADAAIVTVQTPMDGPAIDEFKPAEGTFTNAASIAYSVNVRDHVPIRSILVEVSADGGPWMRINEGSMIPTAKNHYYSVSGQYNIATYNDSELRFRATATDAEGRAAVQEHSVRVDRVAPPAPTGLTATLAGNRIEVKWDALPEAKTYHLSRSTDAANGGGNATWTINAPTAMLLDTNVQNRPYTYKLYAKDAAGNSGPEASISIVKYGGPALILEEGFAVYSNQAAYTLSGTTAADATLTVNGQPVAVNGDGRFSAPLTLADGRQIFDIVATNGSGSTALKQQVILDTQKPYADTFTPNDDAKVGGGRNDLYVVARDGGLSGFKQLEYQVSLNDGADWITFGALSETEFSQSTTTSSNAYTHYYWDALRAIEGIGQLADGPYKFRVVITDRAGNVSDGLPVRIWVVNNAPYVVEIDPPSGFAVENKIEEIKLSWTRNSDPYTRRYRVLRSHQPDTGFTELGTTTGNEYSDKSADVFAGTTFYYKVQALTNEGVESEPTVALAGESLPDTIAPKIQRIVPGDGAAIGGENPYATVYIEENSRLQIAGITVDVSSDDGATWLPVKTTISERRSSSPYPYWLVYWDPSPSAAGTYLARFTVRDHAGNASETTQRLVVDRTASPPVVQSVSSSNGRVTVQWEPVADGDYKNVKVLYADRRDGTYHTANTQTNASVTSYTHTGVTPGRVYFYKLEFEDQVGNKAQSPVFPVKVQDDTEAPTVTSISPADGSTVGGTSVSISARATDNRAVQETRAEYSADGGETWNFIEVGRYQSNIYYHAWNVSGLSSGTYLVRVSARDAAGNTGSATVTYTLDREISVAQNFKASPEEDAILFTWDPVTDPDVTSAHPYRLYRSETPGGPYGGEVLIGRNETSYRLTGLNATKTYYFVLRVIDVYGNLSTTPEVAASYRRDDAPPVIVGMSPADGSRMGGTGTQTIRVNFTDAAGHVGTTALFEYSADHGETWQEMEGVRGGPYSQSDVFYFTKSWVISSLSSGTYIVKATVTDASGNRASTTVAYEIDRTPPGPPQNLIGQYGSGIVELTWEPAPDDDVKHYKLYRATSASGPYTLLKDNIKPTDTSYVDSTVQAGLTYYYKLAAVDTFNQEGAESNIAEAYARTDTTAPVITRLTPDNGAILSPTSTITVNATDNLSVSSIALQASFDGGETWVDLRTKAAVGGSAQFTLETVTRHGELMIRAIAFDSAGNPSSGDPIRAYVLDLEAPTTAQTMTPILSSDGTYIEKLEIALTATDGTVGSGVQKIEYRINGGAWTTYVRSFTVTAADTHTVEFRSIDKTGNVEATWMADFDAGELLQRGAEPDAK